MIRSPDSLGDPFLAGITQVQEWLPTVAEQAESTCDEATKKPLEVGVGRDGRAFLLLLTACFHLKTMRLRQTLAQRLPVPCKGGALGLRHAGPTRSPLHPPGRALLSSLYDRLRELSLEATSLPKTLWGIRGKTWIQSGASLLCSSASAQPLCHAEFTSSSPAAFYMVAFSNSRATQKKTRGEPIQEKIQLHSCHLYWWQNPAFFLDQK